MSIYMIANFYSFGKFVPIFRQGVYMLFASIAFLHYTRLWKPKTLSFLFSVSSMELSYVRRSITDMALESRYHMLFACSLLALSVRPEKS